MTDSLISSAYSQALEVIASVEPRIAEATRQELADQRASLKLIASENYASPAVLMTMGTWFSDKYAEGTVGHRFYAGCQNVDTVESLAAEHARELFGAPYAYVQPHSGIDANLVAFWSILANKVETPYLQKMQAKNVNELSEADWETLRHEFGNQRLLGMSLDAGGHLTHGFRPNISGKMFHQQQYGTDPETGLLDYDAVAAKAREFKPLVLVAGYSAYPRRVNFAKMREIADEVGAVLMVDMAHFAGLVAGKVFTGEENPVPYAHITTTTTHKSLRGPRGGMVLAQEEFAADVDRGCPMVLGGPLSHVMAAKAVAMAEARTTEFQDYAQRIADNAKSLADGFLTRGANLVTGGTDNHLVLLDVSSFGLTGRQAESASARRRRRHQPQLGPVRPQRRLVHLRRPARHPGAHHPRLRPRRVRHRGGADRRRAVPHRGRHDQGRRAQQGVVRPGRRSRRPGHEALGRDARQAPALPRSRPQLTGSLPGACAEETDVGRVDVDLPGAPPQPDPDGEVRRAHDHRADGSDPATRGPEHEGGQACRDEGVHHDDEHRGAGQHLAGAAPGCAHRVGLPDAVAVGQAGDEVGRQRRVDVEVRRPQPVHPLDEHVVLLAGVVHPEGSSVGRTERPRWPAFTRWP